MRLDRLLTWWASATLSLLVLDSTTRAQIQQNIPESLRIGATFLY